MPIYTGDKFGFGKSPDGGGGASAGSGEAFFPEPGQYDWVCPEGVTKVCVSKFSCKVSAISRCLSLKPGVIFKG